MNNRQMKHAPKNNKRIAAPKWLFVFAVLVSSAVCGCQPLMNKKSMIPWSGKKKETKVIPDRILAVWTDTVLHQQGQTGVRGFGGRVYFYEKDRTDPIEVEGSLAVYAFDAEDDAIDSQKPLRKFVFTTEQLASRMSKTSIGPSYSVWLPWSAVGDPPQKLSLITRFEGVDGGTTISDPVIKLLPGIAKKSGSDKKSTAPSLDKPKELLSTDQGVQQASYAESKAMNTPAAADKRPVETIELPPGFHRHLKNSDVMPKGFETNAPSLQDFQSAVTTQVFDAKNPPPRSNSASPDQASANNTSLVEKEDSVTQEGEPRLFSSSRPDRSNIRSGSWLKPERRLQDGIERKQDR
ncbi:MAG: hypothetical protein MUC43_06745 [Pirellula sp.]|jgi:hypothetical protein|nr:hypothetical protein [Pirellula sp.]